MIFLKSFAMGLLAAFVAAVALGLRLYFTIASKVATGTQVGFSLDFLLSRVLLPLSAVFLVGAVLAYQYLRGK